MALVARFCPQKGTEGRNETRYRNAVFRARASTVGMPLLKIGVPLLGVAGIALGLTAWAGSGSETDACAATAPSPNGALAATFSFGDRTDVYVQQADGAWTPVSSASGGVNPVWSPDGRSIAYVSGPQEDDPVSDIWIARCDVDEPQPIIANAGWPAWSPDGTRLAFSSDVDGVSSIYIADVDGSHVRRITDGGGDGDVEPSWSPDGTQLAYTSMRSQPSPYPGIEVFGMEVFVVSADGGAPRRVAQAGSSPRWSPDGMRIAFSSSRTFTGSYRMVDADGTNEVVISEEGRNGPIIAPGYPAWRPYTMPALDEPLCLTRPQDGIESCLSHNWFGTVSWTPTAAFWRPR